MGFLSGFSKVGFVENYDLCVYLKKLPIFLEKTWPKKRNSTKIGPYLLSFLCMIFQLQNFHEWKIEINESWSNYHRHKIFFVQKGTFLAFVVCHPPLFLSCDLFKKLSWVVKAAVQRSPISWSYLPIYELWYRLKYSKVMFEMYRMPYAYK